MVINFQEILAIIPTLILLISLLRDWWKDKKVRDLEEKKLEHEQFKQSRADLESDYERCREELQESRLREEKLIQAASRRDARIEQLEKFIIFRGMMIPEEGKDARL